VDTRQFDILTRMLSAPESRRRLLGALAASPVLGGLVTLLDQDEAEGRKRRERRKDRHRKRKDKAERKRRKRRCKPKSRAKVCAGRCGVVKNRKTCGKRVNCGSCDCDPPCGECFTCQGNGDAPGTCVPAPDGTTCSGGNVCCGGACQECCDSSQCDYPNAVCVDGTCEACTAHAQCGDDALCIDGVCVTCDVTCPSGDAENCGAALQAALDGDKDTLYVCPGTYQGGFELARAATVIGAGAGQTILDGNNDVRVLAITANVPVTLEALTITRGKDSFGGGGIHSIGPLTLIDAELTANKSTNNDINNGGGGAIITYTDLTLRNTIVRENTSALFGGGILVEGGTLTLESGSSIEENVAPSAGAGIFIKGNSGTSTVVMEAGSQVSRNRGAALGGGICIAFGGALTLRSGSQVTENEASTTGGAIYIYNGTATIEEDVLICGNSAQQCDGAPVSGPGTCPDSATCNA
jgi:hypothetical protein